MERPLRPLVAASALLALLAAGGGARLALRLQRLRRDGRRAAASSRAFERRLPEPAARVLVLGDSTGVGVGAHEPAASFAGWLSQRYPAVEIVNRARNGAKVADVAAQLDGLAPGERFDLVLLHVGGNDLLARKTLSRLRGEVDALLGRLRPLAPRRVWLGVANVGLAPAMAWPLSRWLSARGRRAGRLFAARARAHGVEFIDFFRERGEDRFSRGASLYFAPDGLHPSAAAYRHCFEVVRREAALDVLLAAG